MTVPGARTTSYFSTGSLAYVFRFRDELREGKDVEPALVETMTHAGRSVIVSGSTVAVGLLSLMVVPVPQASPLAASASADLAPPGDPRRLVSSDGRSATTAGARSPVPSLLLGALLVYGVASGKGTLPTAFLHRR
jgi:hypothetical protein